MANTLTNLIPSAYATLDVVSRELVGLIPSVSIDARANMAALNQTVYVPATRANGAGADFTPAMSIPAAADQTIDSTPITISKVRVFPFSWTGEEQYAMNQGPGINPLYNDQIAQALRAAVNEIEADLATLQAGFSRAYGTAGTTPFNTAGDFTDASETLRIIVDNGGPQFNNSLVMDTAAGARFKGKQAAATTTLDMTLQRQGILQETTGLVLRESAQILAPAVGTASGATVNNAGYAVGATVLTLSSAGTGTILAGDVVTFAGDTNKYLVTSGDADVSNGGTITIAAPGLRVAMSAATKAITIVAQARRNMCFARSAIVLATRLPKRPPEGDLAKDIVTITDPRSGLTFNIAYYPGYGMGRYQVEIAWGKSLIKPEHTALLLG